MKTKTLIPAAAVAKLREKIAVATGATTNRDSVNSKILALNRIIGGWCRYYQYTSKANAAFRDVEYYVFWRMVHWLGRKFQISTPTIIKRYKRGSALATSEYRLKPAGDFPTLIYRSRFFRPNPYTTQEQIHREELLGEICWTGYESRTGIADLKPVILERDGCACQMCGIAVTLHTSELDHIKPFRKFKRPVNANHPDNLWTLCIKCHPKKTEQDRQMESRMRLTSQVRFGRGNVETCCA